MWELLSCLLTLLERFDKNNLEMGTDSVARQIHQHCWVNIVLSQITGKEFHILRDPVIQPIESALNWTTFLTQTQALLAKVIGEHMTQENTEVKSIINKDHQVAPKWMPLGAPLAVSTNNIVGRFVESVKNVQWLMSPQEGRWSRKHSWVPDSEPVRVWGQISRMETLYWWRTCNKTYEGWPATSPVITNQVVAWHAARIWKWRVVAKDTNASKV